MKVKCIVEDEGYWTVGEMYSAYNAGGGFILVGDDDDDEPNGYGWSASPVEYHEDGSIIYQLGGLKGDVRFKEENHDN